MRILTLFVLVLISACGQTGKLYLPESQMRADSQQAPETNNEIQAKTKAPNKQQLESELKAQKTDASN